MAGAGYKLFVAGNVLTAAQMNTFVNEQTVMVFATAAARDAALTTVKAEGNLTYQADTNSLTSYSGAAWSTIGPINGALTTWTPTVTQSVSVTVTNTYSRYTRIGRMITGWFQLSVTGAGTAANAIIIGGLPFASTVSASLTVGAGSLFDTSAAPTGKYPCFVSLDTTTTFGLRATSLGAATDNRLGIIQFVAGLAVGDLLDGSFSYEAAADA